MTCTSSLCSLVKENIYYWKLALKAVTTLPPSPSLEAAVEATTIDQCCFHNTDEDRGDTCSPFDCRSSYDNHHSTALSSLPSHALQSVALQTTAQSTPVTPDSLSLSSPNSQATATSQANLSTSAPASRSSNVLIGLDHIFTSFLMKMEVLSVQNHHIQKQFGVIGSTKVKKGKIFYNLYYSGSENNGIVLKNFIIRLHKLWLNGKRRNPLHILCSL